MQVFIFLHGFIAEGEDKGKVGLEKLANEIGTKRNIVNASEMEIGCTKLGNIDWKTRTTG